MLLLKFFFFVDIKFEVESRLLLLPLALALSEGDWFLLLFRLIKLLARASMLVAPLDDLTRCILSTTSATDTRVVG